MVSCHQPTDCTVIVTATSPIPQPTLDKKVFLPTFILVMLIGALLVLKPESAQLLLGDALQVVTGYFGWLYLLVGFGAIAVLVWLAFSRYGRVKLGAPDDGHEFSTPSWIAMMFTVGIGIGLTNWAFVEPIFYFQSPPVRSRGGYAGGGRVGAHVRPVPLVDSSLGNLRAAGVADCLFPVCPKTAFLQGQYPQAPACSAGRVATGSVSGSM